MNDSNHSSINGQSDGGRPTCACSPWWRLPLILALVLAAIALLNGRGIRRQATEAPAGNSQQSAKAGGEADATPSGQRVSLVVDIDGRRREWAAIPWRNGMTVADVLRQVGRQAAGSDPLTFTQQGADAFALLTELGGVGNEGVGGRNWTYRVNDRYADRSFAVYELAPGDQVLWQFTVPR